jgi:hypothetical protein
LLYTHKQFCSRFVALVETVPDLKQLLKDVFIRNKHQSIWDSLLKGEKWPTSWIFLLKIQPRLFVFVMLTKCCIFAIKTESWLLSKLFISSVSGEYHNSWENCGFLSFSVIVTLVHSWDGLVERLLWSFVIAPLLSYCLNFCKGTITVIVLQSEYRYNAVFAVWETSVL